MLLLRWQQRREFNDIADRHYLRCVRSHIWRVVDYTSRDYRQISSQLPPVNGRPKEHEQTNTRTSPSFLAMMGGCPNSSSTYVRNNKAQRKQHPAAAAPPLCSFLFFSCLFTHPLQLEQSRHGFHWYRKAHFSTEARGFDDNISKNTTIVTTTTSLSSSSPEYAIYVLVVYPVVLFDCKIRLYYD